jgi:cobalt/nickel transport system ATP-binding protein
VEERVHRALQQVELANRVDDAPQHLSYGERKRAALATVLAMAPRVVALDEPFSNLHPALVRRVAEVLAGVDSTLVVVSQEILPVLGMCQRVAVLTGGRIRWVGPVAELVKERRILEEAGLDFAYYCSLCRALAAAGEP